MTDTRDFTQEKKEVIIAQALRVRKLQKEYFRTIKSSVQYDKMKAEKELDKMLDAYFSDQKQERLF